MYRCLGDHYVDESRSAVGWVEADARALECFCHLSNMLVFLLFVITE